MAAVVEIIDRLTTPRNPSVTRLDNADSIRESNAEESTINKLA